MRWRRVGFSVTYCLLVGVLVFATAAGAQQEVPKEEAKVAGGGFEITRSTLKGGAVLTGGIYEMRATVGQSSVGTVVGSVYRLRSGFWAPLPGEPPEGLIFEDGFETGNTSLWSDTVGSSLRVRAEAYEELETRQMKGVRSDG